MLKLYQNKEWLRQKYIDEELSTVQIAKICGVVCSTIWHWLIKYNIPIRSINEGIHLIKGNHCNLSQEAINFINGELLGDGHLCSQSSYSASFRYTSKYLEYINYISDILKSFGIKQSGNIIKQENKKYGNIYYQYASYNYEELFPIRKKWYFGGKKIVPRNVELNPITLRQHYIGDGCLTHKKNGRPYIRLATYRFFIKDVEFLVRLLNDLGFKAKRKLSENTIYISTHSTKDFLSYIGNSPVRCYDYKFAY